MTVVVAFVEEGHFALLRERDPELQDEREDEGDEGGLERGGQPGGDALERSANHGDVATGLKRLRELADGHAQALNRADEAQHRNRPHKTVKQRVTGRDQILIVFRLGAQNGGNVVHLADVFQIREGAINAIEQDEVAGMVHERMDAGEHCGGGGFRENELRLGGNGGQRQRLLLELQFPALQEKDRRAEEEEQRCRNHRVLVARAQNHCRQRVGKRQALQNEHRQRVGDARHQNRNDEREDVIDAGVATAFETKTVFDVVLRPRE